MYKRLTTFALIAFALLVQPLMSSHASATPSPDFDGNGKVEIADFLAFVNVFGSSRGDGTYQALYDLNSDGTIDIPDFLVFVDAFGKDVSPVKIYWANNSDGKIQRANLDGSQVEDVVTGLGFPDGIALDLSAGKIYWAERSSLKIQRANLDGSQVEDLVTSGLSRPIEIALDLSASKMYWIDHGTGKVQRANLNGVQVEDLVTSVQRIHGIALDLSAGKMYFGGMENEEIRRANLDGSQIEDLITGIGGHGVVLDLSAGKMYWSNYRAGKIQRANLDGSQVEDVVTVKLRSIALDVSRGKMYWTNEGSGKISRANLDGSQIEDVVTGISGLRGLALDLERRTDSGDFTPKAPMTGDEQVFTLSGGTSVEMVWIEPGTFDMGSPSSEEGRHNNEGPVHSVRISEGFYLGKYEVTQGQWEAVMGTRPWAANVPSEADYPAVYISWEDAQAFIDQLNASAGSNIYRLPSEAEWEYACRAGTSTRWSFGDDASQLTHYAYENSGYRVGTKRASTWGLYDMHGYVWEWVQDWYGGDYYSVSPSVDPLGPSTGSERVVRGGDLDNGIARRMRSAGRGHDPPGGSWDSVGFRLLRRAD